MSDETITPSPEPKDDTSRTGLLAKIKDLQVSHKELVEALDKATRTGFEYTHHDLDEAYIVLAYARSLQKAYS